MPTDSGAQPTADTTTSEPPTGEPTLEPEPTTAEPTEPDEVTPTEPPAPTDPPAPTEPPQTGPLPNLRVQKFETVQEPVLVGEAAALKADITNFADTVAGPFTVQFVVAQPGQEELVLDTQTVDAGLGAGAATTLTTSITPGVAGGLKLIARVDSTDQITETDESDNETVLDLNVVQTEVNLNLPADGLTVLCAFDPATPRTCLFTVSLTNSGQSTMTGPMSIKYFGYSTAGDSVEWGTFDFDIDLAPGGAFNQQVAWTVEAGTYRGYALADSGEAWAESSEEDNEAFVDFTSP